MPWSVNNIDLVVTVVDRSLFSGDSDAALVLLVAAVHD